MCIRDTRTRDTYTRDMRTRDMCTRIRDIGIRAMGTHDTCTRGTPGMMDIVAGTDTETTGRADDMFGRMGVRRGRRGDGHMAAGIGGEATGTGS